jgi:hypothetical protein
LTLGSNTYISAAHFKLNDVNAGVLIVHEILHTAGIRTRAGYWTTGPLHPFGPPIPVYVPSDDPIVALESEIKKICAPNLPGN